MESNEIKLSYEACVEEPKVAKRELHAYQQENEFLKRENEALRTVIDNRTKAIEVLTSTRDAYRDCISIMAGKWKR